METNGNKELTLYHYKEPLLKNKDGYGYLGALSCTKDGKYLECHICGELYADLAKHVIQGHKISARSYREKFQLAYQTKLISETERMARKERFLEWLKGKSKTEQKEFFARLRKNALKGSKRNLNNRKGFQPKETLERKNKKGTCPDQLLDKIKQAAQALGHTPSKHDFIGFCESQRFLHLIYKTFGSYRNALKILGMQPKQQKFGTHKKYSDAELLEYLRIYAQENRKIPTYTDCRRGLLPTYDTYIRRWGSMENARRVAGVYEFINPNESPFYDTSK